MNYKDLTGASGLCFTSEKVFAAHPSESRPDNLTEICSYQLWFAYNVLRFLRLSLCARCFLKAPCFISRLGKRSSIDCPAVRVSNVSTLMNHGVQ